MSDVKERADVNLVKVGAGYRAVPPRQVVHVPTRDALVVRNNTRSEVLVWFPGRFLVGDVPAEVYALPRGEARRFRVGSEVATGVYPYAAYVVDARELVEGHSPPDIIIDR